MYFLGISSSRSEKRKKKKRCRNCFGLLPKLCHDIMENCIVTWPYEYAVGWEIVLQ